MSSILGTGIALSERNLHYDESSVVVRHLLAQGKSLRVMTRNPLGLAHLKQQGVEIVSGDLRDRASLASACQGVEQVLTAAHALDGKGDNNPRTVDDMGNRHLIDAAKAAGVKHFMFVSVQSASLDAPLEFFRIKYRTVEYLRASGLSFTILRPWRVYGTLGPADRSAHTGARQDHHLWAR